MRPRWARALHRAVDRIDARWGLALRRRPAVGRAWVAVLDAVVAQQADRVYFAHRIVPAIARAGPRRILFVGVRGYTRRTLRQLGGSGAEVWTADIDPSAASHGVAGRHVTCAVEDVDAHLPAAYFDLAIVNGVFGWGCDTPVAISRALSALHCTLAAEGVLLLGWNADRAPDLEEIVGQTGLFAPTPLGELAQRQAFAAVTHVYAWYRRNAGP